MCTVSFISVKGTTIISSNRDENVQRKTASAPSFELINNKRLIFPKDAKAGGTWFAAADNGVIAVLLNGAFIKHTAKPPYRKSRGLILLEIIASDDPIAFYTAMDLQDIEPFTLVLYGRGSLHELRWDGEKKHNKALNSSGNYIWSSVTLYSDEVIGHRKKLFDRFINETAAPTAEQIYQFHSDDHQDEENGFVINRQTGIKTFSITQAIIRAETISFLHTDLLQDKKFEETMHTGNALIDQ